MTVSESHLLTAMLDADDWLDLADLWRRATVPASAAEAMLVRNGEMGFVEHRLERRRDSYRLTDRGKAFVQRQQQLPVAKAPWGLDLVMKRKQQ